VIDLKAIRERVRYDASEDVEMEIQALLAEVERLRAERNGLLAALHRTSCTECARLRGFCPRYHAISEGVE